MMADPYPYEISTIFDRKRPIGSTHSRRPVFTNFFELQRRMRPIPFEQREIFSSELLHWLWQGVKTIPELGSCPMHSQIPKLSCHLGFHGFPFQEIKLTRGGIFRDLPVPVFPVHGFNPFPKFHEFLLWQRGYFSLDML